MIKKYAVHNITFIILVSYTKTKPVLPKNLLEAIQSAMFNTYI